VVEAEKRIGNFRVNRKVEWGRSFSEGILGWFPGPPRPAAAGLHLIAGTVRRDYAGWPAEAPGRVGDPVLSHGKQSVLVHASPIERTPSGV
jgi:hypothetical protein